MDTKTKIKAKTRSKALLPLLKRRIAKRKKNPIELFGILKDKIFFAEDEFLVSRF